MATASAPLHTGRLLERTFVLNTAVQSLGYASYAMVLPVLPLYLVLRGEGETFVGLLIAAFNVTSFLCRPWIGMQVDGGNLRSTLLNSCLSLGITPFLFLMPSYWVMAAARAVQGVGWAGLNVTGSAWAAQLAPPERRAEALGYYTLGQRVGLNLGPVAGLLLFRTAGAEWAFIVAGVCSLLATAATAAMRQRLQPSQPAAVLPLGERLVEKRALFSAAMLALTYISFVPLSTYMPLTFRALGLEGVEWYFLGVGLTGTVARLALAGRVDRLGRTMALAVGMTLELAGLALLLFAADLWLLVATGVLFQLGGAIVEPTLYAIVIDRTPPERRGVAMATCTAAFQLGDGVGSTAFGWMIEHLGHRVMLAATWAPTAAALAVVGLKGRRERS